MKLVLAPSILSFDPTALHDEIRELEVLGADLIHLDVMDGQFVPPITFGSDYVRALRKITALPFEAHLMTLTPEAHFAAFVDAGCARIIFPIEATSHPYRLAQQLRMMGVHAGAALNPGTPVEAVLPLLRAVDLVLVMTVNPGWGGQAFIPETLDKVRRLRAEAPDLLIEVDGGITPATMRASVDAGANVFVTGSYLANRPLEEAIRELRAAWG